MSYLCRTSIPGFSTNTAEFFSADFDHEAHEEKRISDLFALFIWGDELAARNLIWEIMEEDEELRNKVTSLILNMARAELPETPITLHSSVNRAVREYAVTAINNGCDLWDEDR